jgi:hypothetical protein
MSPRDNIRRFKNTQDFDRNTATVQYKNKGDTNHDSGNWNNIKVVQKNLEQHTRKVVNQGNAEISHIWHCTHAEVKVQKYITCSIRGGIQNILDWFQHLYNSCGSAKHR